MDLLKAFVILNLTALSDGGKLLFFLVDGFRWDYFDLSDVRLTGFPRLFREGSRAEWMIPDFPTNSFPNYKTLETGLHVESHGMTGNFMWDEETDKHFEVNLQQESSFHPDWWNKAESFFITAEKQGIRTGLFHVCGCNISIDGFLPTYCLPYTTVPSKAEVNQAISDALRMLREDVIDIAYIYHQSVDSMGHYFGPNSHQVIDAVQEVDVHINNILAEIEEKRQNDVDVIVLSDHGMASVDKRNKINITKALDMSSIREIVEGGTQAYIWPFPGKEEQVYASLKHYNKHLHVYYRAELKDRWFFKRHKLIPPIFVNAEKGWYIVHPKSTHGTGTIYIGNHGFDNNDEDMRAIFAATGPDFKKNYITKPFNNVNVYQIICHVTGIKPHPHNGTWAAVSDMFIHRPQHSDL